MVQFVPIKTLNLGEHMERENNQEQLFYDNQFSLKPTCFLCRQSFIQIKQHLEPLMQLRSADSWRHLH